MIHDYFSLYSKDQTFFLLRIHHKVDFSDEIAWAHCWNISKEDCLDEITKKIFDYLTSGFDIIQEWQRDQEGWHESIKHLGFEKEIIEMELLPAFIESSQNTFVKKIQSRFETNADRFLKLEIPTYVGSLYNSLVFKRTRCKKPRVASAVCYIKVGSVLSGDWAALEKNLDQYS